MDPSYSPVSISQGNKKPLVIFGVIASIIAVIAIVALVIVMNMLPKKSAEEEYNEISASISEYIQTVYDVDEFIEKGYNSNLMFSKLYGKCDGKISEYSGKIASLKKSLATLSYDNIDADTKTATKILVNEYAPKYFDFTDRFLEKISTLCEAIVSNNSEGIKNFTNDEGIDSTIKDELIFATNAASIIKNCQNDAASCNEAADQLEEYTDAIKEKGIVEYLFHSLISSADLDTINSFQSSFNKVVNLSKNRLKTNSEENDNNNGDEEIDEEEKENEK